MSGSIKLKHASGNGVIISAPSTNPSSDKTITLPSDESGTFATKDSANSLQNVTEINGGQLANRSMFVNGGMEVAQRLSLESSGKVITSGTNYYGIDMFLLRVNDCSIRKTQSTDVPVGFCKSLKLEITSADTSLAAGVFNTIVGSIEGYDIVRTGFGATGAKTLTLSFFVKSNLTGTFTGSIGNSSNNRSYAFDYTISSANTWERKTITFDGDTTGTWHKDNQLGLKVTWALGVGSNFLTSTSTTWQGAEHMGTTNGQNVCGSTSNNFFLTGVQLEVGNVATTFEHRSYAQELALCQRYFRKLRGGIGCCDDDGVTCNGVLIYEPMRANPSVSKGTGNTFNYGNMINTGFTSTATPTFFKNDGTRGYSAYALAGFSNLVTGAALRDEGEGSSATFDLSAEL